MAAWLPLVRLLTMVPNALDAQLRNEAGISDGSFQEHRDPVRGCGPAAADEQTGSAVGHLTQPALARRHQPGVALVGPTHPEPG